MLGVRRLWRLPAPAAVLCGAGLGGGRDGNDAAVIPWARCPMRLGPVRHPGAGTRTTFAYVP